MFYDYSISPLLVVNVRIKVGKRHFYCLPYDINFPNNTQWFIGKQEFASIIQSLAASAVLFEELLE